MTVDEYMWTFNMPTDQPRMTFTDVWVPDSARLGPVDGGLAIAQSFVHQNRIRQAASSLGAAVYCIEESVKYARERKRSEEHTSELQSLMRISYAVFCSKKKKSKPTATSRHKEEIQSIK